MRLFLCTYDDPDGDRGANDVIVQAADPQQAFEVFVEAWRKEEFERYGDAPEDDEEGEVDKIREAFKPTTVIPANVHPANDDYIRVFEILPEPSRSRAGVFEWVHGLPVRDVRPDHVGVMLLHGYWMR